MKPAKNSTSKSVRASINRLRLSLLLTAILITANGCSITGLFANKVVLVDGRTDIWKVGPKTRGYIYYQNEKGEWVKSANKVDYPEGHYVGRLEDK